MAPVAAPGVVPHCLLSVICNYGVIPKSQQHDSTVDGYPSCSGWQVVLLGPTASAASSASMPAAAALANEESADVLERQDGRNAKSRKTSKRSGEEVVVTLPGGELHYYPRTKQLCATCRCPAHLDGDCRRWRTMRKGPRADGRPVGLLVAWIQSASKYKSRTEHCLAGSLHVLNRQRCHEAREYFRTLSGSDLILNEEAPVMAGAGPRIACTCQRLVTGNPPFWL